MRQRSAGADALQEPGAAEVGGFLSPVMGGRALISCGDKCLVLLRDGADDPGQGSVQCPGDLVDAVLVTVDGRAGGSVDLFAERLS